MFHFQPDVSKTPSLCMGDSFHVCGLWRLEGSRVQAAAPAAWRLIRGLRLCTRVAADFE